MEAQGYKLPACKDGRSPGGAHSPNQLASQSCLHCSSAARRRPATTFHCSRRSTAAGLAEWLPIRPGGEISLGTFAARHMSLIGTWRQFAAASIRPLLEMKRTSRKLVARVGSPRSIEHRESPVLRV